MALVMYMLSEYYDFGTSHCNEPFAPEGACGHYGDSEAITLRVRYESGTMHWIVDAAWFSEHEGYGVYCGGTSTWPYAYSTNGHKEDDWQVYAYAGEGECDYGSGDAYPPTLEYTGNGGSAPYVHVAIGVHANYSSESECTGGNPYHILLELNSDTCNGDAEMTVDVPGDTRNVGSSDHHDDFLGCRESGNPAFYQFHEVECYWSGNSYGMFGGWQGASPMTSPYSDRLNGLVFGPL
jgi:hypothetical protein